MNDDVRLRDHGRTGIRALREAVRVAPRLMALFLTLTALFAASPAVQVWAVRHLTDGITADADGTTILLLVVLVAAVIGLTTAVGDARNAVVSIVNQRLAVEGQARVGEAMAVLTPRELADSGVATRARAARDAATEFLKWHARAFVQCAEGLVSVLLLLVALWPISATAAVVLVLALAVGLPGFARISHLEAEAFPRMAEQNKYAAYYTEQLVYQRTAAELGALGSSRHVARLARNRYLTAWRIYRAMMLKTVVWTLLTGLVSAVLIGVALWIVATSPAVGAGGTAAGVVGVLSGAGVMLTTGFAFGTLAAGTAPVRELFAFVDGTRAPHGAARSARRITEMRCESLGFAYPGAALPALRDVAVTLRRGEMVAFVGLNGAGKTTLVNCLAGLYEPSSGVVLVDGEPMTGLSDGERLGLVSLLTQEFGRYELTVREAVGLGRPDGEASDDELWAALRLARADGFVREMPDGLDTQLGQQWGGVGLSGGQWQRIALARIALRHAPVWLLDEPTSAVDAVTEEEIFADLGRTRAERITVVVSHRAWTLRSMDRIYVLDGGLVVEQGTYAELLAAGGRFAELFRFQAEESSRPPGD